MQIPYLLAALCFGLAGYVLASCVYKMPDKDGEKGGRRFAIGLIVFIVAIVVATAATADQAASEYITRRVTETYDRGYIAGYEDCKKKAIQVADEYLSSYRLDKFVADLD